MTATTILRRKLRRPVLPETHVRREALLKLLHRGLEPGKKLTAVIAGPGYGKSTLVTDYAAWVDLPCAWYGLDEGDADPVVFLSHLIASLQEQFPSAGSRSLELLQSARLTPASVQNISGLLTEELVELTVDPWLLVLDDIQFLQDVPLGERALAYLIQYFPDTAQLILIGRSMPELKLPQLQVRQQVVEVTTPELRLAPDEIAALVQAAGKSALSSQELETLQLHTEGWLAGLILTLHGAQRRQQLPDQSHRDLQDWHRPLFAYLAEETFDTLPKPWQTFLLETALPPHFNVEVCEKVLHKKDARQLIVELERHNLFIESVDQDEYRYHPLFREFLLAKRKQLEGKKRLRDTYTRLAHYFAGRQPEAAIACWLQAEDYAQAERVFEAQALNLLRSQRLDTLNRLLQGFPRPVREHSAWLELYAGELERQWGNFDRARAYFQHTQELAQAAGDDRARGWALAYQGAVFGARGEDRLLPLAKAALETFPTDDRHGQAFALNLLGGYYLQGDQNDPQRASNYLQQSLEHYQAAGDAQGQARVLHNLGLAQTKLGLFEQAIATYRESIHRAQEAGQYAIPLTYNNLGIVLLYQGRLAEARIALQEGLSLAQSLGMKRDEAWAYRSLGVLGMEEGTWSAAAQYLEQARTIAAMQGDRLLESNVLEGQAGLARRQGRGAHALALLQAAMDRRGLKPEDPGSIDFLLPLGLVYLERKELEAAQTLFRDALGRFEQLKSPYHKAEALFLLARAAQAQGDQQEAEQAVAEATRLAEIHGYRYLAGREATYFQGSALEKFFAAELPRPEVARPAATEEPTIRVTCFGRFEVQVEGVRVAPKAWRGVKTQVILAYLLHNRQGLSREQLSEMFYADQDTTPTAIYVLISRLRRALEADLTDSGRSRFIKFHDGRYVFNFGVRYWLDTEEFCYSLDSARSPDIPDEESTRLLRRALELYTGTFLPEFYAESWVQVETEHYRRLCLQACDRLLERALGREDFDDVFCLSDRTLSVDRCHEQAHQAKMEALVRTGQREQALRHFALMQKTLQKELGTEPSPQTSAVYQRILKSS